MLLGECSAQRMKEQTEEHIRISSEGSIADARDQNEALAPAAALGRDATKLQAVITKPFPHGETEQGKLIKSSSFDMPLLPQDTHIRPAMKPHYTVPGPAIEGPAKP
eukprot:3016371-Pyramimonas_sp.AAC.1